MRMCRLPSGRPRSISWPAVFLLRWRGRPRCDGLERVRWDRRRRK
jgi:hypothetical protein